jgi:signal transduction histidine kinase
VNEKSARYKLLARFSLYSLPATLLAVIAWILSIYTPFLKSLGQVLLTIILLIPLLLLTAHLTLRFINKKYLEPLLTITSVLQSILSRSFKPLPQTTYLGDFQPIYLMLTQIQNSFIQDQGVATNLIQINTAQTKLFETSLMEITDPVIVLNLKLEVAFVNNAAEFVSGIKRINVVGKKVDQFLRFYNKQNLEITPSEYVPRRDDPSAIKVFNMSEVKVISNINRQSFADLTVFLPELGEIVNVSCIILLQDKTKEKALEAMKLDFVSMAAHELRTPLTSIKGYISVFINENKDKLTPEQMMFITRINTSTQQLSGLVENLLSVSRVERGAMNLHTQSIDWVANVKQQVDTFEHRATEKRISLKFIEPTTPIPQVQVDLVRMNEVLNNMVSNAINYTEPMGKIEIWVDVKEDQVCTHVRDTGKGIPKESLPKLFSKFFRVQGGSAEQASKGNGLGLYLSKAIVELHKGKIWVESAGEGKGSTFSFSLPAVADNINIAMLTKSV